jgi:site-specific recombinase XerD
MPCRPRKAPSRALKGFAVLMPEARQAILYQDLTQTTPADIDAWITAAFQQRLAPGTIVTCRRGLQGFFVFLCNQGILAHSPLQLPRHQILVPTRLPKPMAAAEVVAFFRVIDALQDRTMFLLMLRCGLRVSEVAQLKLEQVDWEQHALHIEQGKGRKDRRVYMSPDAVASLHQCLVQHPGARAQGDVFWNRKRAQQPLSVKAIQKKMERYAKAAGITASCHSLRHTFASNLLEHGAEVVAIRDFLGHSQIASTERYAKISSQKIKQEYMRTMQKILKQGPV